MKNALLIVSLFVTTSAFAQNTKMFVGKYTLSAKTCTLAKYSNLKRAYIKFAPSWDRKFRALEISMYGDDASMLEIKLGSGTRQKLGTSVAIHGKVTESWKSGFVNENTFRVITNVKRPSVGYDQITYEYLNLKGGILKYIAISKNKKTGKVSNESCVMKKA